jgi:DNA polymerase-3 subunit alpha
MISLIKGGAFDSMMDRKICMGWYIWETCDKKQRITLQNLSSLFKYDLVPQDDNKYILAKRVYEFNRYLKAVCKEGASAYKLDDRAINFITEIDCDYLIFGNFQLDAKQWDKIYQGYMDIFREWIAANKEQILIDLNAEIFKEAWYKYAKGNYSSWEMEALCFYYHEHELININPFKYGFVDFFKLSEDPVVEKTFRKSDKEIKMFKINTICGTCLAKNKAKSTVTLLTTTGVVEVKFRKEYFSMFDRQISIKNPDGTKKVMEKSWFNRGNMIVVQGIRSGDNFVAKKYSSTPGHTLYRIETIVDDELRITHDRYQGEMEEDNSD